MYVYFYRFYYLKRIGIRIRFFKKEVKTYSKFGGNDLIRI